MAGPIPDRANRPLIVKCGYEGGARRITFPSAANCRLDSLRLRVEECFHLSASPFFLTYIDDDGEEFSIRCEADLTEAIAYFVSGDDDQAVSSYSGNIPRPQASSQKITIRLDVILEYDGPSLSDTSSLSSFNTGNDDEGQSENSWRSSGYDSYRSYGRAELGRDVIEEEEGLTEYGESGRQSVAASMQEAIEDPLERLDLGTAASEPPEGSLTPRRRSEKIRSASASSTSNRNGVPQPPPRPLTGPESEPAPSLLTHTELGSRWLREQSRLTRRQVGPASGKGSRRYDSDDESLGSDEDLGDLALVRDARGKYYYSYQSTETSSLSSRSEADFGDNQAGPSTIEGALSMRRSPQGSTSAFEPFNEPVRIAEPSGPPILAPDCSACGVRLDYMRYVCRTCGEGEMWKENAPDKAAFVPLKLPSDSDGSSETTEHWGQGSNGSETIYNHARSRSGSHSTNASLVSLQSANGSGSPHSRYHDHGAPDWAAADGQDGSRGYELCAGCIEVQGIAHSRAAAKTFKAAMRDSDGRRRRKLGEMRHTFREKIWAAEGWVDVDYSDDSECTMCKGLLLRSGYKCYHKVEEIHPAHAFLSLPDKSFQLAGSSRANGHTDELDPAPKPVRHPGAFCHNCLQDIVGPRFHCAVCPSWDLCIQCEGVSTVGDASGHTSAHILMKIPIPLANAEVEAVSRRARDRWFQQDSTAIAAAAPGGPSSRSSSPTNDTIYAATTTRSSGRSPQPSQVVNIVARDALDHGCRCNNCNEWIMGRRFQCANCPSEPEPFNLCSICELRSYRIHDPRHVFFKFDRPVHVPLQSARPLLPLLYKNPVGAIPAGAVINPRDPTAYLKHVLHRETLCDIHSDQIRGIWLRCAHCAAGFDICQDAEQIADHDATHVFVVFKARVDMTSFRALADLGATHSKPLLKKQVYLR